MSICRIEEKDEGRSYPRTCPTCKLSGACAKGLDRESLKARIRELEAQVAEGVKVRPLEWVERRNDTWEADGYQVCHTYDVFWRVRRHGKILCRNIKGRDRAMDWSNRHNERRILSALEQPATPHGT